MTADILVPDTISERILLAYSTTLGTSSYPRRAKYTITGGYKTAPFVLPRRAPWSDSERDRDFLDRMHNLTVAVTR